MFDPVNHTNVPSNKFTKMINVIFHVNPDSINNPKNLQQSGFFNDGIVDYYFTVKMIGRITEQHIAGFSNINPPTLEAIYAKVYSPYKTIQLSGYTCCTLSDSLYGFVWSHCLLEISCVPLVCGTIASPQWSHCLVLYGQKTCLY